MPADFEIAGKECTAEQPKCALFVNPIDAE